MRDAHTCQLEHISWVQNNKGCSYGKPIGLKKQPLFLTLATTKSPPHRCLDSPPVFHLAIQRRPEEGGPTLVSLRFPQDFVSTINDLAQMMAHPNKISPASPYLNDIFSDADEGPLRIDVARFVGSLHSLRVSQGKQLTGSQCGNFNLLFIWPSFSNPLGWR